MSEIASKSMHNWRHYPSSNWYEIDQKRGSKFGALLWRRLTPQRKTAIQLHNYNPSCIQLLKKDFGKFTSCMTFGAHKLVHSELVLDYRYEIWHSLSTLCTTCGIFLYRCTSTVSALNYCGRIYFKSLSYLYEVDKWCAQTFPPIFWTFAIFDRNFAKIVAPPSDGNANNVVHRKEQSLLKKNDENVVEIGL